MDNIVIKFIEEKKPPSLEDEETKVIIKKCVNHWRRAARPKSSWTDIFSFECPNENLTDYCRSLLRIEFFHNPDVKMQFEDEDLDEGDIYFQKILRNAYDFIHSFEDPKSVDREKFKVHVRQLRKFRDKSKSWDTKFAQKFEKDAEKFLDVFSQRPDTPNPLHIEIYWGSRQQLLCGKVIADFVDPDYGPLDPVFGALLHPTGGRVGRGDGGWLHKSLYDDRGSMAYHAAIHDAFGYLVTYHNTGPGYNYVGAWSPLQPNSPLAGQINGVIFWRRLIAAFDRKLVERFLVL